MGTLYETSNDTCRLVSLTDRCVREQVNNAPYHVINSRKVLITNEVNYIVACFIKTRLRLTVAIILYFLGGTL
jgi:hypothetical protein